MTDTKRRRLFRGLEWWCVEGHHNVISSSFYRLSKVRISLFIGKLNRGGEWCPQCGARNMPGRIGRTVRLEDCFVTKFQVGE